MSTHPRSSRRNRRGLWLAAAIAVAWALASTATGTEAAAGPTSSTSSTGVPDDGSSSTTQPPSSTTSAPGPATTVDPTAPTTTTSTTVLPLLDDVAGPQDAIAEAVPETDFVVPPRPPSPGGSYGEQASRVIRQQLRVARAEAVQIQAAFEASADRVEVLAGQRAQLQVELSKLSDKQVEAIRELQEAERVFETRIADAFIRGNVGELSALLQASDVNEFVFSNELTEAVAEADLVAVERVVEARRTIDAGAEALARDLRKLDDTLDAAQDELARLRFDNQQAQFALRVFAAGGEIVISGFVFPVGTPNQFSPTFGAPRMAGSEFAHSHQGTDILADFGTPLYAAERGVITKMGVDILGGQKLWIKGESGTHYYYAHLQSFEPGIGEGTLVDAGDVVGTVGDTGNARGGVPHLHFEIHPDDGPAVDPYPLLRVVADLDTAA